MKRNELTEDIAKTLSGLPDSPGVYLFKSDDGEIIYIGKALSLRNRVRSYWNDNSWKERPKLYVMMPKVLSIETILTNSEKEALILEATLVRQHMPRYNVHLKDDKRYPWLAIEYDVPYPRLIMVRDPARYRKGHPKAKIFGPYVEAGAMWETVKVLRHVFPMRQRRTPLFKDRPCMNFHIGLCLGPCQKLVQEERYMQMVKQVEMFLAGRQSEVVQQLKQEMNAKSEQMEYEQAAKVRDRLAALETMIETQQVFFQNQRVSQDIISEAHSGKSFAICMMRVREGKLISSECVSIPLLDRTAWDEAYQSYVDQYYTQCEDIAIPSEVILERALDDTEALEELLSSRSDVQVKVTVPQRGKKLEMIEMAKKNAGVTLEREIREQTEIDSKVMRAVTQLQEELNLKKPPMRIECFDISNIQGTDNVASMVVFEGAQAKKTDYRLFKIRSVEGEANDFASMKEVVGRRYLRVKEEGKPMPDLIIIDGGKGQLGAAMEALKEIQVTDVEIIGLAKKQEEVYFPGQSSPVLLPRRSEALFLLQRARDEAHRFAVTYHRKLRAKRALKSEMDALPGIGETRRKALLDYFGTFAELKKASAEELAAVPGIAKKTAQSIFSALHKETPDE